MSTKQRSTGAGLTRRRMLATVAGLSLPGATAACRSAATASDPPIDWTEVPLNVSAARQDRWKILGPGGGGALYTPAINPHDPDLMLASSDMTGMYLTRDGGKSWRNINLRSKLLFTRFDPVRPNIVYAANGVGVYRSNDAGATWALWYPDPASAARYAYNDYLPEVGLALSRYQPQSVLSMVIDPQSPENIYVSIGVDLYQTTNDGRSWTRLTAMKGAARFLFLDPRSPARSRTLYMVHTPAIGIGVFENGAYRTQPPMPTGPWIYNATMAFPQGDEPPVFYIVVDQIKDADRNPIHGGLVISRDGGESWKIAYDSILAMRSSKTFWPEFVCAAVAPGAPNVAYASYLKVNTNDSPGEVWVGVAKTTDYGNTWELVWKENQARPSANVRDIWVTPMFGAEWGENPLAMAVHPTNPDMVLATDLGRVMITRDGGATWDGIYSRRYADGSFTTNGIDVTTCYGVHFDPFHRDRMIGSYTDIGMIRSDNGGRSWTLATSGVPREWRNTTYWVEFDPQVEGRAWAGVSRHHDLPQYKMFNRGAALLAGGIVRSEDGGRTWRNASDGLPSTAITHLLMDPTSEPNARVLYATGFGRGVFKSSNDGRNWEARNNGLPEGENRCWRLARDRNGVLYVVVYRRAIDEKYGGPDDGGLYRSTDGAENWERIALPEGVNGPSGIAIDPEDPQRLYLSAWARGKRYDFKKFDGGLYLSTDGGATWRLNFDKSLHVYDVTIDARDRNVLYAATYEAAIWRSNDAAKTWTRIPGFNFANAQRVIPDPYDTGMIYVATLGGSLWYGPAEGDPQAVEDLVQPVALRYSAR